MPKAEVTSLDNEINDFLKSIPNLEKEIAKNNLEDNSTSENKSDLPPVRSSQDIMIGSEEKKKKKVKQISITPFFAYLIFEWAKTFR